MHVYININVQLRFQIPNQQSICICILKKDAMRPPTITRTMNHHLKTTMRFCTLTAIAAYQSMLDKVREANTHLSEVELHTKLCEARDEYSRQLRIDNQY
jgi:hypothetical protein